MAEWLPVMGQINDGIVGESRDISHQTAYGARAGGGVAWQYCVLSLRTGWLHRSITAEESPVAGFYVPPTRVDYSFDYWLWEPEVVIKKTFSDRKLELGCTAGTEYRTKLHPQRLDESQDQVVSLGAYFAWNGISLRYRRSYLSDGHFVGGTYYKESSHSTIALGYDMSFRILHVDPDPNDSSPSYSGPAR